MGNNFVITKSWFVRDNDAICLLFDRPVLARYSFEDSKLRLITGNLVEPIEAKPMLNICRVVGDRVYCFPDWYDKVVVYGLASEKTEIIELDDNDCNIYDVFYNMGHLYAIVTSGNYILDIDTENNNSISKHRYTHPINRNKIGCEFVGGIIYIPEENGVEWFDCVNKTKGTVHYEKTEISDITNIKHIEEDSFVIVSNNGKTINIAKIIDNTIMTESNQMIEYGTKDFEIIDLKIIEDRVFCVDWNRDNVLVIDLSCTTASMIDIDNDSTSIPHILFLYQKDNSVGFVVGGRKIVEMNTKQAGATTLVVDFGEIELARLYRKDSLLVEGDPLLLDDYIHMI